MKENANDGCDTSRERKKKKRKTRQNTNHNLMAVTVLQIYIE